MTALYPTSAFDYELPADRIAQTPSSRRDESRLMVLDRCTGDIEHRRFRDLAELVSPGDALVLNETRVFPARLVGRRASGAPAEVLLLHPVGAGLDPAPGAADGMALAGATSVGADVWEALVRPGNKLGPGRVVSVAEELSVEILDVAPDGNRIVRLVTPLDPEVAIQRHGQVPLPPYVSRKPTADDAERYQTVFAREAGSVAAPTAGLHFTAEMLHRLESRGVEIVRLVLHIGVGTFRPVEVEDPDQHVMHAERYTVPEPAAQTLNEVRARGGRIWAVGTTVVRALETVADEDGTVRAGSGWTRLFIRPPYVFRAVDHLVTNFHLPRSTLLMLVAAFAGYEHVMAAYRAAVAAGYRFYSYGDAMLVRGR